MKNTKAIHPDYAIRCGTLLTMDSDFNVLTGATVEVSEGKISGVLGKGKKTAAKKILDATDCIVMPGLVNGHTHTGMTLLRGVGDDLPLHQWLRERIFPLERKWGNEKFVYLSTQLAALEMIRSGTTLFNDMYYYEESAAKAVNESGLRAICGQTIIDISGVEAPSQIIEKFEAYLKKVSKYPLVVPAVAPHSIYGVAEKAWPELIAFAQKHQLPLHIHLSETVEEEVQCQKEKGMSSTEFFERVGLWETRAVAAHAVVLTEKDIEILGKYKVGIAHNAESNMKLGNPICPVVELRASGANVVLGTDGTSSNNNLDLLQEADFAAKLQVLKYGIGKLPAREMVKILTIEGAQALGMGELTGSIEIGKSADIIAVSVTGPHATPLYDPYSHLVYSASGSDVKHSMVNGKILMKDRKILTLNEEKILQDARTWGKKISSSLI